MTMQVSLAPAEEKQSLLTLEEAVRRAVSWHPSVEEALDRLRQSTELINEARAGYYPRVRGGLEAGYDSERDGWQPTLNLSGSQMVYDFGKVDSAVNSATEGARASQAEVLGAVDELIRETAQALIEVQRYQQLRRSAQEQLAGVLEISELVKQRTDTGASTRSDEFQAAARVETAQGNQLEIEAQLARWESNLFHLIGATGKMAISPEVPAWLAKTCDGTEPDWAQVPALMEADARRKEALAKLEGSKAEALPTLSLEAGTAVNMAEAFSEEPEFNVGLNFSGNLYDGGAAASRKNAAAHALEAADAARDRVHFEIMHNLTEARQQTHGMSRLLSSLAVRDDLMRETRDLYRRQYVELGTRSLLDLLNAESELHQARFDKTNLIHDLRRLDVDCLFYSGRARQSFALQDTVVRGVALAR